MYLILIGIQKTPEIGENTVQVSVAQVSNIFGFPKLFYYILLCENCRGVGWCQRKFLFIQRKKARSNDSDVNSWYLNRESLSDIKSRFHIN